MKQQTSSVKESGLTTFVGAPARDASAPGASAGSPGNRPPERSAWRWFTAFALALLVAAANLGLWNALNPSYEAPAVSGKIAGLAYNGFQRWDSPIERKYPSTEEVDADLALLAGVTDRIRSYSSSELPQLPALAEKHGLRLTAGVWLAEDEETNRREVDAIKAAVQNSESIERVVVGNESLLRGDLTPRQLMTYLDELRYTLPVPVSTAEPWHIWFRYPELAQHVDFITVHLLPFWEGVPAAESVKHAMDRLDALQRRFPNRKIVIGEIGWPSQGDRFDQAKATPAMQAAFIREFLSHPKGATTDYYLMEAIDQPWKIDNEGRVGAHWGIFNADRSPKFALQGPVQNDANWREKAVLASLLAVVPIALFAAAFARWRVQSRVFFAVLIQVGVSLLVWLVALPFDYYLRPIDWAALGVLLPALLAMLAILLANGFEFAEMFWKGNLRRSFAPQPLPVGEREPFVSVHLACCNEPPEMVIATLESLARLDYRNFEVLVVDNNTRDEALWRPVEARVAELGERFRFFHLPSWPGFKAGALNFALEKTDPRAEVVGVVDADYVVRSDWLRALVGHFAQPEVAVVQAPQAHRQWGTQVFRRMMNWEYDGFFRIGMHHRNERDAIIQHGTMTLIRADALRNHGRWSEWCICEDAELGLRLMKAGMSTVYVDRVFGEGLTPDDFAAFGKQRRRWALGAMQILKAHWRSLVRPGSLTGGQRFHFLTGWLSWFGDALHLVFALAAMVWTLGVLAAPRWFSFPIALFMLPLFAFFIAKAMFGPLLYWRHVGCRVRDIWGAALAGMALSHCVARGIFAGLAQRTSAFEVTRKGSAGGKAAAGSGPLRRAGGRWTPVREELLIFAGLIICLFGVAANRIPGHLESALWMAILALQSIPYLAALGCNALAQVAPRQPVSRAETGGTAQASERQAEAPSAVNPVSVPALTGLPVAGSAAAAVPAAMAGGELMAIGAAGPAHPAGRSVELGDLVELTSPG